MILSISFKPKSFLNGLVSFFSAFDISFEIAGRRVWFMRVDFPEPETPVTHTNKSKGRSKSTDLRL